ncbi:Autophagy protein 5 [Saitozyma sp. JCM 24511]|nr:Autophagy protein 5 [Saitozyma sp. JCM 24511]
MSTPTNPAQSSANLFRRLAWQASIPLEIRLAEGEPGAGSGCDRYYIQAPRHSYLPLLIPEIRENLVELALDDQQLADTREEEWWFEEEPPGEGETGFAGQGACRWHWPLDLIHLHSLISRPAPAPVPTPTASSPSSSSLAPSASPPQPLRLLLHLSHPPADKLLVSSSPEACRTQWINQLKEADFVRWRNTAKVTSLRKGDLEAGWDGIIQDDYDLYMRMASRVLPLPIPPPSPASHSRPPSTDPSANSSGGGGGGPKAESAYTVRALPIKIYLPDNAPVVQEVITPLNLDGKPATVLSLLRQHLPLLFPPMGPGPFPIAFPVAQGVELPAEAELAWLASCLAGADGWLRIGIRLVGE